MASENLFGRLKLGKTAPGENPHGDVQQTSNGNWFNGKGGDGDDWVWGPSVSGPRWNKTDPDGGKMQDRLVPRPVVTLVNRRR